jgi:NADH dehydrogenase
VYLNKEVDEMILNNTHAKESRYRIVVVGANFAGLAVSNKLSKDYEVTVVDPSPYFEFLPNIHELVSRTKTASNLRLLKARLIQDAGHEFCQDRVQSIDTIKSIVMTENGKHLPFDVCVVSVGGVNNTFGVKGVDAYSMPFKSVANCQAIGDRLYHLTKEQKKISVVIVGGGLEGIEAMGEVLRAYKKMPGLTIHMVQGGERLFPGGRAAIDREIRKACKDYSVHIHTKTTVIKLTKKQVFLSTNEKVHADIIIWTGGVTAPPLLYNSGLAEKPKQWAPVHSTLQSKFFDNVFVAGDAAQFPQKLDKKSHQAVDMGILVAENVQRFLKGTKLKAYEVKSKPTLITFGDLDTYLIYGNQVVAGTVLWPIKEALYQYTMARIDPPVGKEAIYGFEDRTLSAILRLAIPTLFSPFSLLRLANIRWLSDNSSGA